ncbi:MAG TPA: DNA-directed RNA polymerase, subunit E'' [Candidatus Bathyarchaeota archaeon]|nr:MAG: DNA-directed RNA polymerase subunit E'' [Candidatus Bathyarchaeota archaeon ex4484_40]HDJ04935.1 DNA-directed RNA polymerase, subunit E'' [Candidatus Bathyarchaeota archaeon]
MSERACRECHRIFHGSSCPYCKSKNISDDFSGLVIIIDPENSAIAKVMNIKEKGRYAIRVR